LGENIVKELKGLKCDLRTKNCFFGDKFMPYLTNYMHANYQKSMRVLAKDAPKMPKLSKLPKCF